MAMPSDIFIAMEYYKINSQVLFRNYGDFGYLTDNRNFGYNFSDIDFVLGDIIVSESGASIISCLEKYPLSIGEITRRASQIFGPDINYNNEIVEFLDQISSKGFIIKGKTLEKCKYGKPTFRKADKISNVYSVKMPNEPIETQSFLAKYFGDKPFPTSIHVEIASECNERCIHCYIPHELKTDLMDDSLFYEILDQSREMKLLHITISGGEPFLHPHIVDFLKRCREYDMSVNVLTNLTLFRVVLKIK